MDRGLAAAGRGPGAARGLTGVMQERYASLWERPAGRAFPRFPATERTHIWGVPLVIGSAPL